MNNEEALFWTGTRTGEIKENKDVVEPWKLVTLGGVTGFLMGAGSLYAGQMMAKEESEMDAEETPDSQIIDEGLRVADVEQGLTFSQAFAAARAEVGPGGVFYWNGGIYNTFTAEEWNSMSQAEKNVFAQHVNPEVHPNELSTPTDANPQIVVVHHVYHHIEVHQPESNTENTQIVDEQADGDDIPNGDNIQDSDETQDGDVHIVGYANVEGHLTVGFDMNNDGMTDVAIIDVDDNLVVSSPDLVVDRDGNMATVGEIVNGISPNIEQTDNTPDNTEASVESSYSLYDI